MHYSVASSDSKARRNVMTFRAINCVNPLPVGVKTSIYPLNGESLSNVTTQYCHGFIIVERVTHRASREANIFVPVINEHKVSI